MEKQNEHSRTALKNPAAETLTSAGTQENRSHLLVSGDSPQAVLRLVGQCSHQPHFRLPILLSPTQSLLTMNATFENNG